MTYTCFGGPFDGMEVQVEGREFVLPEFDPLMGYKDAGVRYEVVKVRDYRTGDTYRVLKWVPR